MKENRLSVAPFMVRVYIQEVVAKATLNEAMRFFEGVDPNLDHRKIVEEARRRLVPLLAEKFKVPETEITRRAIFE